MGRRIYLSGGWNEHKTVAEYGRRLVANGFELSCDWMSEAAKPNAPHDNDISREARKLIANDEIKSVVTSQFFWLLIPTGISRGSWTEFGAAIAAKSYGDCTISVQRVFVSGQHRWSLFADHDGVECFDSHEEAYTHLISFV
jgi:hypothetical protein